MKKDNECIVTVGISGLNLCYTTLSEVTSFYKLSCIQIFLLKQKGELILHNGLVTLNIYEKMGRN